MDVLTDKAGFIPKLLDRASAAAEMPATRATDQRQRSIHELRTAQITTQQRVLDAANQKFGELMAQKDALVANKADAKKAALDLVLTAHSEKLEQLAIDVAFHREALKSAEAERSKAHSEYTQEVDRQTAVFEADYAENLEAVLAQIAVAEMTIQSAESALEPFLKSA